MSMLPSLIAIFMISSTTGMASDLGAGEKERFTFEPLLSTSVNRSSIITGKIVALCTVAFISLLANIFVMTFSFKNSQELMEGLMLKWIFTQCWDFY